LNQVFCPQCGKASPVGAPTCPDGHSLPVVVQPTSQPPPEPVKKSGFSFVTLILAVLAFLPIPGQPLWFLVFAGLAITSYFKGWGK
jgi:hypothetical protein